MIDKTLIRQVSKLVYYPVNTNTSELEKQINALTETAEKYQSATFNELASQYSNQIRPLQKQKEEIQKAKIANKIREQGYFVIQDPEWDHYYGIRGWASPRDKLKDKLHDSHRDGLIPIKFINSPKKSIFSPPLSELKVLCSCPTTRFKGAVPDFVVDRILEEKEKNTFCGYDIFFVEKLGKIDSIVREFVLDPILVGRWKVGRKRNGILLSSGIRNSWTLEEYTAMMDKYCYKPEPSKQGAVLAMWGTDLEEIEISLLSS